MPTAVPHNARLRDRLLHHALSDSTHASYNSGAKAYLLFISLSHIPKGPLGLPICSENLLIDFVCHCSGISHLTYSTIKSYLSGIRHLYIVKGYPNPLVTIFGEPLHRLQLVLRGIQKSYSKSSLRQPVTIHTLHKICTVLRNGFFGPHVDALMEAACTLAFFGFLRCGEFTTNSPQFRPDDNLCVNDISFLSSPDGTQEVLVNIKVSKTDPFRKGVSIRLFTTGAYLCPVSSLVRYMSVRNRFTCRPNDPFFVLPDMTVLSRTKFLDLFHSACSAAGISSQHLTGHSFRLGAACSAAKANFPDYLIQALGRWRSDCYKLYIRTPSDVLRQAQRQLALSSSTS